MKYVTVILGLFVFMIVDLSAQIAGRVIDKDTKDPIIFGTLTLYRNGQLITGTQTDFDGFFSLKEAQVNDELEASYVGSVSKKILLTSLDTLIIELSGGASLDCVEIIEYRKPLIERDNTSSGATITVHGSRKKNSNYYIDGNRISGCYPHQPNHTESYEHHKQNKYFDAKDEPLSTFSIDVDDASYANIRRFVSQGMRPPADAVRVEELINYFNYEYDGPKNSQLPFAVHTELGPCPWNNNYQLLHIGIQGDKIKTDHLPASNLVFLVDVSGSMRAQNKLPLLIQSLKLLVGQLDEKDMVSIVTYAGRAGIALPPTSGADKKTIVDALERLSAGGSTAGAQGIKTAYELAEKHFIDDGNNRIILATDGDFNVGVSSDDALEKLIESKRSSGVFLSVLGFGMGNYKDSKMQRMAQIGNGQHSYIDRLQEAQKVLVEQMSGTIHTIAKDVKIQIEFNPAYVQSYRLVGYESRILEHEDFNDDTKDAGDIGSGHSVTALYEIVPIGADRPSPSIDPLKYQKKKQQKTTESVLNGELATVKLRFKQPKSSKSTKIEHIVSSSAAKAGELSNDFHWSAAIAGFGMLLKNDAYILDLNLSDVDAIASAHVGRDEFGYRREALTLIRSAHVLLASESAHVEE